MPSASHVAGIPIQEVDTAYKGTLVATSDDNTRVSIVCLST